ncbi:thiol S-methyltransferase TMT1A-like [Antennarius striatus]|uniref:thiol S-methyltransferase TMT1A-like n=1 Tax=Antennarius striatus TaxID=241820 RepID=UPI0035B0F080
MSLLIRLCTLVVNVFCLPLHLLEAVGLYKIYKHFFPKILYNITKQYNRKMRVNKAELFDQLPEFARPGGQVTLLEIGCGTGANFEFYPPGSKVICTDPNPNFQKYLKTSMDKNDHLVYERFLMLSGEDLSPVRDASVDVVVCTLVLCTVDDVQRTVCEIHRVLKPGGAFFFMEHVVADTSTWMYFLQHVLQPLWYYFGDGCRLPQPTWKYLESAGFSELKIRHIMAPLFYLIKPHITGYAVK